LTWFDRLIVALATLLASALLIDAAPPYRAETVTHASLAGQLLVASPSIGDPRFDRAVILIVRHNETGAFGIVINRPIAERPLAGILKLLGEKEPTVTGTVRIFSGGPVQPEANFVVHSSDYRQAETIVIDARLAMTSSREILHAIGDNKGPQKSLVVFGYAGWGPRQLDNEMDRRVWFTAPAEPKLIFDEDRDKVWELAYAHRTQDL
jgi:putative transcriptional regulator